MVDIVTRLGKGSPLTNAEVDANFTNLAEVSGVTGEPMGHEDRTTSTISFNASTRTFTIAPTASSFTVWCKGKKVVVSSAQTVVIPNTTGMYSIYFDSTGALAAKAGYFTFAEEAPTAYVYWNATTGTAPYFGDERHGVVLDWQTHEYLHRTRGAALASGFSASGYVLGGNGSSNSHAQLTIEGGTFFDEDMKIIVTATNTPTAGTWEQDLLSPARIPVLYLSGTAWVIDSPTDYPLKQGTSRPQYNAYSGGVWSTADVANNKYATSWILATNNLTYPVIAIIGQAESDLQSAAEAVDFTELQLPGFPSVEFRPLYKLIFQCADSCTNAVHASLVSITDIRSIAAAGTAASIVTDHGNLSGLSDDDHPQYIHVDTLRTVSAAVKASFLPSQTSNAGKFLQTDGTATSWQALTSGNVTTALGFTPYNATNPSGFITGITSGNVTTALGFTPYNATNPSGYVTAAGARGAISVTGAGSYDSATGVINIVGGVTSFNTRTGAITLSSSDVTTALGFTPYNSTNPNGYLTGITSTQVTTALGYTPYNSSNPSGYITGITSGMVTTALGFTPYNNSNPSGYITSAALSPYLTTASAASTYAPLTGTGASGTWNISITGNAATAGSVSWTNISSGVRKEYGNLQFQPDASSFSGMRFLDSSGNGAGWFLIRGTSDTDVYTAEGITLVADKGWLTLAQRDTGGRGVRIMSGTTSTERIVVTTAGDIQLVNGNSFSYNSNAVLHAGNYSSYAHSRIVDASGTGKFLTLNSTNELEFYNAAGTAIETLYLQYSGAADSLKGPGGNTIFHAGNYNSYALPLSGGTLSGALTINAGSSYPLQITSTQRYIARFYNTSVAGAGWWLANDANTLVFHADSSGDKASLNTDGVFITTGSFRAPLFYDNNDTTYYGDFASTSVLNNLNVAGAIQSTNSNGRILLYGHLHIDSFNGNDIYLNYYSSRAVRAYYGSNVESFRADTDGIIYAFNQFRTPIFYDSNNTAYYVDPASTSNLNNTISQAYRVGTDSAWKIRGNGGNVDLAFEYSTSSTLSDANIKAYLTGGTFVATGDVRAPIFYDSNNTNYYVDPAAATSGSFAGFVGIGNNYGSDDGGWGSRLNVGGNAYARIDARCANDGIVTTMYSHTGQGMGKIGTYSNHPLALMAQGASTGGYVYSGSIRAPIFYDSDDTTFYVDSNNTSTSAVFAGNISMNGAIVRRSAGTGYLSGNYASSETTATTGAIYTIGGSYYPTSSGLNTMYGIGFTYASVAGGAAGYTGGSAWGLYVASNGNTRVFLDSDYGRVLATGDMRAPIYYDSQDTAYYTDPNSYSNLSRLNVNYATANGSTSSVAVNISKGWTGMSTAIYDTVSIQANDVTSIRVGEQDGTTGGYCQGDGYNTFTSTSPMRFFTGGSATAYIYNGMSGTQGLYINSGVIYSNGFYDNQDSSYYTDPNGGSALKYLRVDGNWGGSPFGSGSETLTVSGSYASICQRSTISLQAYVLHHVDDQWSLYIGRGVTNGSDWNWAIRAKPSQDGNYVEFRTSARAPIFYDFEDTGYYVNPNGSSYLHSLILSGNSYFRPNNWIQMDSSAGIYWPNHYGAHLYSNTGSTYTQIRLDGQKNGYDGMWLSYSAVNGMMYDSAGNGGVYREANGRWYIYYHLSNDCLGIGTASTNSSYGIYCNKGAYLGGRVDGTIFYDASNTTYYVDPNDTGTSVRVAGNVTAYYSDMRLKTHLGKIENALEKVRQLEGFYYEANEIAQKLGYKPKREVGVSAQAVQAVLPEIVTDAPINANYLTIDYERLTPLLIEAVKEQNQEVVDLRNRVAQLESLITKLIGD